MPDRRIALVVATDHYDDPGLRRLASPAADAVALAETLGDEALGGFEVDILRDATASEINERVEEILNDRDTSDLVLLHFSCHGLKDDSGELYLAARNTLPRRLASTAVDAALVDRLMRRSRAQRVVLLLDCCYGGAFERGMLAREGGSVDVGDRFSQTHLGGGRGRAVITASGSMEFAFEGGELSRSAEPSPSIFTGAVVEGIRTGAADRDQDGQVGLDELYDYVYARVGEQTPNQTPRKWEFDLQGDLYIARNPRRRITAEPIPEGVRSLVEHPVSGVRLGAVDELRQLALGANLQLAAGARLALHDLVMDDSKRVSKSAADALEATQLVLSAYELVLEQMPEHPGEAVGEISLGGPPLALASTVAVPDGSIRAVLEGTLLHVSAVGQLPKSVHEATVVISGPAGEAHLHVTEAEIAESLTQNPVREPLAETANADSGIRPPANVAKIRSSTDKPRVVSVAEEHQLTNRGDLGRRFKTPTLAWLLITGGLASYACGALFVSASYRFNHRLSLVLLSGAGVGWAIWPPFAVCVAALLIQKRAPFLAIGTIAGFCGLLGFWLIRRDVSYQNTELRLGYWLALLALILFLAGLLISPQFRPRTFSKQIGLNLTTRGVIGAMLVLSGPVAQGVDIFLRSDPTAVGITLTLAFVVGFSLPLTVLRFPPGQRTALVVAATFFLGYSGALALLTLVRLTGHPGFVFLPYALNVVSKLTALVGVCVAQSAWAIVGRHHVNGPKSASGPPFEESNESVAR